MVIHDHHRGPFCCHILYSRFVSKFNFLSSSAYAYTGPPPSFLSMEQLQSNTPATNQQRILSSGPDGLFRITSSYPLCLADR
jgi:hypothetical protein